MKYFKPIAASYVEPSLVSIQEKSTQSKVLNNVQNHPAFKNRRATEQANRRKGGLKSPHAKTKKQGKEEQMVNSMNDISKISTVRHSKKESYGGAPSKAKKQRGKVTKKQSVKNLRS